MLPEQILKNHHDGPILIALPLLLLAFGSLFIGYLARDMTVSLGTPFWGTNGNVQTETLSRI